LREQHRISCCSPVPDTATLHTELSDLLAKFDVNTAAASVKIPKADGKRNFWIPSERKTRPTRMRTSRIPKERRCEES